MTAFLQNYRDNLESKAVEREEAMLRCIIDHDVFNDEALTLHPSYRELAVVKMASPRGAVSYPVLEIMRQGRCA